jgi:hypothetical protein
LIRTSDLSRKASPLLAAFLLACCLARASAQEPTVPETPFEKQIHKMDLSISGVGMFNNTVSGPVAPSASDTGQDVTQYGSNTLGALVAIHYTAKPYVGFEFNYGYARYTENFTVAPFQVQTKVNEYTLGYVVTPPHPIFGFQPFASAGSGSLEFKPTAGGGQGLPTKARQVYYYSLGLQKEYSNGHLGLRAGFRELFFLDPDFGQNYLTILKHATTYEPMAGFYLRY